MQKWAKFTRQVESSMIRLTGTRFCGLSTFTPLACLGRSPLSWARTEDSINPMAPPATLSAAACKKSRLERAKVFGMGSLISEPYI